MTRSTWCHVDLGQTTLFLDKLPWGGGTLPVSGFLLLLVTSNSLKRANILFEKCAGREGRSRGRLHTARSIYISYCLNYGLSHCIFMPEDKYLKIIRIIMI